MVLTHQTLVRDEAGKHRLCVPIIWLWGVGCLSKSLTSCNVNGVPNKKKCLRNQFSRAPLRREKGGRERRGKERGGARAGNLPEAKL